MRLKATRWILGTMLVLWGVGVYAESSSPWMYGERKKTSTPAAKAALAFSGAASAPFNSLLPCPVTEADWRLLQDHLILDLLAPVPEINGNPGPLLNGDEVARRAYEMQEQLEVCASSRPLANLQQFARTLANYGGSEDHRAGHVYPDEDYIARAKPIAGLPCLLTSSEFLKHISSPKTYKDAWDLIERQNNPPTGTTPALVAGCKPDGQKWETLVYESRYLSTPDAAETFGRFLVVVPGRVGVPGRADETHDRWIQFGIWTPGARNPDFPINNVSVVAVAKKAGQPNVLLDWWREYDKGVPTLTRTRFDVIRQTGNCQQCHKTAVIGIHPKFVFRFGPKGEMWQAPLSTVDSINRRIRDYPPPDQSMGAGDEVALPTRYGPPLGPVKADRASLLASCTKDYGLDPDSVKRVGDRMTCANCHNNEGTNGRGTLNFPLAILRTKDLKLSEVPPTYPNLVYGYIKRGLMPPVKHDLPALEHAAEREALFNCLTLEYFDPDTRRGLLTDWLRLDPMSAPSALTRQKESLDWLSKALTTYRTDSTPASMKFVPSRNGARLFASQCASCHSTVRGDDDGGPSLAGILASTTGAADPSGFTSKFRAAGAPQVAWDTDSLWAYLLEHGRHIDRRMGPPGGTTPGAAFTDPAARKSVVEYLMTLK